MVVLVFEPPSAPRRSLGHARANAALVPVPAGRRLPWCRGPPVAPATRSADGRRRIARAGHDRRATSTVPTAPTTCPIPSTLLVLSSGRSRCTCLTITNLLCDSYTEELRHSASSRTSLTKRREFRVTADNEVVEAEAKQVELIEDHLGLHGAQLLARELVFGKVHRGLLQGGFDTTTLSRSRRHEAASPATSRRSPRHARAARALGRRATRRRLGGSSTRRRCAAPPPPLFRCRGRSARRGG